MLFVFLGTLAVAEGFFFQMPATQPAAIRGHVQGTEENYNNRFVYQSPNREQFSNQQISNQKYYQQGSGRPVEMVYNWPNLEPYQAPGVSPVDVYKQAQQIYQQHQQYQPEVYRQPVPEYGPAVVIDPVLSDVRGPSQQLEEPQEGPVGSVPLLIKLTSNQAIIVPVRSVYSLPGFLERIVERVQNRYSVYNPVESLTLDRPPVRPALYGTPLLSQQVADNVTASVEASSETSSEASVEQTDAPTTEMATEAPTTVEAVAETTLPPPEQTTAEPEPTTVEPTTIANQISPEEIDLEDNGYNYPRPSKSFNF